MRWYHKVVMFSLVLAIPAVGMSRGQASQASPARPTPSVSLIPPISGGGPDYFHRVGGDGRITKVVFAGGCLDAEDSFYYGIKPGVWDPKHHRVTFRCVSRGY